MLFSVLGLEWLAFYSLYFIHLKPVVLVQVFVKCFHLKAMLSFVICISTIIFFVKFMASFTFDFNFSVPQYPMCKMQIILLPYLVSLINVVKHSDSDKQQRKAQRKWKILYSEQCLDSRQEIRPQTHTEKWGKAKILNTCSLSKKDSSHVLREAEAHGKMLMM